MNYNPYENPFGFPRQTLNFRSRIKFFFQQRSALNQLIIINIAVYCLFLLTRMLLSVAAFLMQQDFDVVIKQAIIDQLSCPAAFQQLLYQPWAVVTSIFFHARFWHLFFNLIMLWVAGRIFTNYLSNRMLLITYLAGGIFGNLVFQIAYNVFPVFTTAQPLSVICGASGGIMAILAAITIYKPNHRINLLFFGQLKLVWLTAIFVVIDLISIPKGNAGGHIAHLGGAIFGAGVALFEALRTMQKPSFRKKNSTKSKKKEKFYTSYTNTNQRPMSDIEYNELKVQREERIDVILAKISKSGYENLSQEEKEFLFFMSKRKNNEL